MLINLSELLSNEGDSRTYEVALDMTEFKCSAGVYPIVEARPFTLEASNAVSARFLYMLMYILHWQFRATDVWRMSELTLILRLTV